MNLILLLTGLKVWDGDPPQRLTRVFLAISILSIEMQIVTWTGLTGLRGLVLVNAILAPPLYWFSGPRTQRFLPVDTLPSRSGRVPIAVMALLVLLLNTALPLAGADPYHLERAERILRTGTIAYGPGDPKLNILGWLYELLLADIAAIPVAGRTLLRLHGLAGLALFYVAVDAARRLLEATSRWVWFLLLTVPVVFHQFVLVKNDLLGAVPGFVALVWLVGRIAHAPPMECAWAGWLIGIAIAIKLTNLPLAVCAGAAMLLSRRRDGAAVMALIGGVAVGLVAGGWLFTLVENTRVYSSPFAAQPTADLGNRTRGFAEAAASAGRFALSLFDMGALTRRWWPGRGGWAGTYGLNVAWGLAVLIAMRQREDAKRGLLLAGLYWLGFSAAYPDADLAHRLALAPGLLVVALAGSLLERDPGLPRWARPTAACVVTLSSLQILRSAWLYYVRM